MRKFFLFLKTIIVFSFLLMGFSFQATAQNYALKMNAASNGVIFDQVSVNAGTSWTAEMWVKRNTQSNFSTLIDGTTSKFTLETWAAGNAWTYKAGFSKKGSGDQAFNYVMPLNTWTHLAYTCNGTSVSLYVNGILTGTINQAIDLPLKGFGLLGSPNETALATIDEVRFWKGVRTVAEITANMNKSVDINSPNLLAYWYFDDRATKITDLSASGLQGTNTGCTYVTNDNTAFTTTHAAMTIESITSLHKNEYLLKAGDANQEILCIRVNTTGVTSPLSLTSMTINMNGTSNLANVSKVAVATTGKSATFASSTLLGAKNDPVSGDLTFNGNITLNPGTNYFWVMYDVAPGATTGSTFDASLVSAVVNGSTITPVIGNPDGNRIIATETATAASGINIIPKPGSVTVTGGNLTLTNQFKIKYSGFGIAAQADSLAKFLNKATGFALTTAEGSDETNSISLSLTSNTALGDEGYTLVVLADRIKIQANNGVGLFWGIQSLRQLLPAAIESATAVNGQTWNVPQVNITDVPRFKFRGIHLDVSRHFFPAAFVKRYIDILAMYKINNFHWHLTDDQGWRIEIKKYPKLQTISAWRSCGTGIYGTPDGSKYGGYYTQEEIKEVVAYAASRNVNIIPEIEMPGHSVSVLAAYPEMACTSASGPFTVFCQGGITKNILCGGKEATHTFFKDVLTEVCDLFPGKYIHLGGDEAPKDNWNTCTDCMQRINSLGITGANQTEKSNKLQKSMMEEMAQFLAPKGKTIVGWDEVTHGGIPTGATIQAWNTGVDVATITGAGHDVIMSNYTKVYLDSKQSTAPNEPGATWMGYNTLNVVYGYEPMPAGLTTAQQAHVIGLEGPIWTEELTTEKVIEYMLAPRALALAERGWSSKETTDFENFKERLLPQYERFNMLNWNARKLETPANISRTIVSCEAITLQAEATGSSYFWNDAAHSTTREITVSKSGIYKCYINHLGSIVENSFNVTFLPASEKPTVNSSVSGGKNTLTALGNADIYYWYQGETSQFPVKTGNTLILSETENTTGYFLSSLSFKNNLNSLNFDGVDDLLEFSQSDFLNAAKTYTFESWIKINTWKNTWDVVMNKRISNTNRLGMELGAAAGQIYCHVCNGANSYGIASGIPTGQWIHVAVVYDGRKTGNAERLKFYLNGQVQTLSFTETIPATAPTVNSPLTLGFPGQNPAINYAEVRFWNTPRTADEIKNNMTKLASYGSELELYYPMNSLTGTTLYDVTKGKTATLKNSTPETLSTEAVPGLMVAGCESAKWIVAELTGVENVEMNTLKANIYPNPTTGKFTVTALLDTYQPVKLEVYNVNSQLVYSDYFSSDKINKVINLDKQNKGVYFISVKAGDKTKVMKLVLK